MGKGMGTEIRQTWIGSSDPPPNSHMLPMFHKPLAPHLYNEVVATSSKSCYESFMTLAMCTVGAE